MKGLSHQSRLVYFLECLRTPPDVSHERGHESRTTVPVKGQQLKARSRRN